MTIPYQIIRSSNRKTISITVNRDGQVIVRAPQYVLEDTIRRFVEQKASWIQKHVTHFTFAAEERRAFSLTYGDTVSILGQDYPITSHQENYADFDGKQLTLPPDLPPQEILHTVREILKKIAREYIPSRAAVWSSRLGVIPTAVRINNAAKRWGSCSSKNSLNFSWRLMMAPPKAVDYVIIHELSHILEHNHSDRFWKIVSRTMPDYMEMKNVLKTLSERFCRENWEL